MNGTGLCRMEEQFILESEDDKPPGDEVERNKNKNKNDVVVVI
jgi:hypothetical protein